MRQNRMLFAFILVFSLTIIPVRAQGAFATYPFSLDELVFVYAHTPEYQETWQRTQGLDIDILYTEIQENLDMVACTDGAGLTDDVDIADCLLSKTVNLQRIGGNDDFSISLAALFGLEARLEGCMTQSGWDEICLTPVIDALLEAETSGIDELVQMHPCVHEATDAVDAGCIIEGFMDAQVQVLLAGGLQDWIESAVKKSAELTTAIDLPQIIGIRSEHFVDPNLTNGFSVVFVSLNFKDGADGVLLDAERTELNQNRSNMLMWSTLAMEHRLQMEDDNQQQIAPQYNPSDEVNEVLESLDNPPGGLTADNLIVGLNWFATGAQSQGPGFGGPGSLPVFNPLGVDLPEINLPREVANPSPVTIAILDVFPNETCGKGEVCAELNGKAALNVAFEHHGRFVRDIIVAAMGPSFHTGQVDVVQYAALTHTGVGSVETVIHALHELYVDQGYSNSAAREDNLVVNLSLNLVHPYGTLHPNYDLLDIPDSVKAALSPPDVVEPPVPELNNGTNFAAYGFYQRMRLPYALAIKAILGWDSSSNVYSPFDGHVVFVGAAGNERLRNIEQPPSEYPARLNEVISVSSTGVSVAIQNQEAADLYYSNASSDGCAVFGGDVEYVLPTSGAERMSWIRDAQFDRIPADNQTGLPGTMSLTTNDVNIRWSGSSFSSAIVSGITAYYLQQDLQQSSPDLITTVCSLAPKSM